METSNNIVVRRQHVNDLSLTFRDFAGGPISYMFDMWYKYIMNLQDGTMVQYADAIDANRLDYTVSIYRFILDRSRKTITRWAKATGCFPVNSPTGVVFNKNAGESYVTNNDEFTITFKANRIEYNDPIIPHEFNMLVRRYNQELHSSAKSGVVGYAYEAQNNFNGIPYVRAGSYGHEMVFLRLSDDTAPIIKDTGKMAFKAGVVEGVLYDDKGIEALADIPSRDELIAKFMGSIQSPVGKFVRTLQAIADAQGAPAGEAAAE